MLRGKFGRNNTSKQKSITQQGVGGRRDSAGIAYITIPRDTDREVYITQSFRTGTVSIITENGEVINDVRIGMLAMQVINFPQQQGQLGSLVSWVTVPRHKAPIIVDVYTKGDEVYDSSEEAFHIYRRNQQTGISVRGNAKNKNLTISVDSDDEDVVLDLVVKAANNTAQFNVNVKGNRTTDIEGVDTQTVVGSRVLEITDEADDSNSTIIESTSTTHSTSTQQHTINAEQSLEVQSEEINVDAGQESRSINQSYSLSAGTTIVISSDGACTINGSTVKLGSSATQPLVLGVQLSNLLSQLFTILSTATAPPGGGPLTSNAAVGALIGQIQSILSNKSFTQ